MDTTTTFHIEDSFDVDSPVPYEMEIDEGEEIVTAVAVEEHQKPSPLEPFLYAVVTPTKYDNQRNGAYRRNRVKHWEVGVFYVSRQGTRPKTAVYLTKVFRLHEDGDIERLVEPVVKRRQTRRQDENNLIQLWFEKERNLSKTNPYKI
jgi:hypothetical protein